MSTVGSGRSALEGSRNAEIILNIPGHVVQEEIARGGMGIVYRVTQIDPRREVALKMLLASQVGSRHLHNNFLMEARAIARLDHPNILPIYLSGEYEGTPYFTMKLATRGSLYQRRVRYRSQWPKIAELVAVLAGAVGYAHQRGILHRDLKPGNVLFDESDRAYVTDFGLARVGEMGGPSDREGAHLVGTPKYMAPEVMQGGADAAKEPCDVFALGLILYELLAQRGPFEARSEQEHMHRMLAEPMPFPSTFMSGIPVDLELLCMRCLEVEPGRRPSAIRLSDELRGWLAGKPPGLQQLGWWNRWRIWSQKNRILTLSTFLGVAGATVAIGAAVISVRGMIHFQQVRTATHDRDEENLLNNRVGEVQRIHHSGRLGQRATVLGLLREAAGVRQSAVLRSEAARQLAQPNIGEEKVRISPGFEVERCQATRDLELLATTDSGGTLRVGHRTSTRTLWQAQIRPIPSSGVLEFSRDGKWLAVGEDSKSVSVYSVWSQGMPRRITGAWLGFAADSRAAIRWVENHLQTLSLESGEVVTDAPLVLDPAPEIPPIMSRGDAVSGIVVARRNVLELRSLGGAVLHRIPWADGAPSSVVWSEDRLMVADGAGLVRVWTLPDLSMRTLAGHSSAVRQMLLEPGTHRLWTSTDTGESFWWDIRSGAWLGKASGWLPIGFSADGQQLLVVDDRAISLRPIQSEVACRQLDLSWSSAVSHLEFSPGDEWILTVQGEAMGVWDAASGRRVASVPCRGGESAHFSPSGTRLALVEATQVRWFLVTPEAETVALREYRPPLSVGSHPVRGPQLTAANGSILLVTDQGELLSINVERGEGTKIMSGLPPGGHVAVDVSGQIVAVSSRLKGTTAWAREGDVPKFALPDRWGPLIPNPDGGLWLQPGAGEHRVIDVGTGAVRWTAPAEPGAAGFGVGAWLGDGRLAVAGSRNGSVRLLQADSGILVVDLPAIGPATSVAANREGTQIAVGTGTGAVSIWSLPELETALTAVEIDLPWKAPLPNH